jgi:lipoic acid synthetase
MRLADSVAELELKYTVITCVDRDDLPDGGSEHWMECINAVRARNPGTGIEVLTGDFRGDPQSIATVVEARPDVFAHNVEVVPRLQPLARPSATWERSLGVLEEARRVAEGLNFPLITKTSLMLGIGETDEEARDAIALIASHGIDLLTIGQYLKPLGMAGLLDVDRYITPAEFDELGDYARSLGFKGVASSPLTRSSYFAETLYADARDGS